MVLYVASELDSAVIGKLLGTEELGFYSLAATISVLATLNLSKIASSIMMPAYSKLQGDVPALRNAYLRALTLVFFLVAPATAGMIVLAEPLLWTVYGEKWSSAAVPLRILAFFGLFRALLSFSGYLFEGMGKPRVAFHLGLLRLLTIAPLIVPMVQSFGLEGAAWTVTLGSIVQWLAGCVYLRKYLQLHFLVVLKSLWRPFWTSILMALLVYLSGLSIGSRTLVGLVALIAVGVVVYGLLNLSFVRKLRYENLR